MMEECDDDVRNRRELYAVVIRSYTPVGSYTQTERNVALSITAFTLYDF